MLRFLKQKGVGDARLLKHGYLKDRMEASFHLHLWDQSHVTLEWNTRETGDIYCIPWNNKSLKSKI